MNWIEYENTYKKYAKEKKCTDKMDEYLDYAKRLYDKGLPIIYDQTHFSYLVGVKAQYLHAMSNCPKKFYRTFCLPKNNGGVRKISEPLPDLKYVQQWILREILYKVKCSPYAKAYIPGSKLVDNARFHKKQVQVLKLDVRHFFDELKQGKILNVFLSLGYQEALAVFLTKLCCLKGSLPQGAPTSAYLSNLALRAFDNKIGQYCVEKKIRYTRYADDMTFSGNFDKKEIIKLVKIELGYVGLELNQDKTKLLKRWSRQAVTGIVVNEKMQVPREYRMKIKQEVYFIKKYTLENHLAHIGETRDRYLYNLIGRISYVLSVNKKDVAMMEYRRYISDLIQNSK